MPPNIGNAIVVPGFMGTQLVDNARGLLNKDVWYSNLEFSLFGPDNLQLAPDGISPGPLADGALSVAGPVDLDYYGALLARLSVDGWNTDFYPWDWRQSLSRQGPIFASFLANKYANKTFTLVCHSMGGLLARVAYPLFAAQSHAANWQRTVYMATPHGGSHWAALAMAGNFGADSWTTVLGKGIANATGYVRNFPRPPNPIAVRFLSVLASMPGLYDLMPSQFGPYADLDLHVPQQWLPATWTTANPAVTVPRLTAGQADLSALAALLNQPRPQEICIVGTGLETPRAYLDLVNVGRKKGYSYTKFGDGTVTVERATLPNIKNVQLNVGHTNIVQKGQVLEQLTGWMLEGLPNNEVVPVAPIPVARYDPPPPSTWTPPKPPIWKQVVNDP